MRDDVDDTNVFYRTFAGSVRISGTVRLPEQCVSGARAPFLPVSPPLALAR